VFSRTHVHDPLLDFPSSADSDDDDDASIDPSVGGGGADDDDADADGAWAGGRMVALGRLAREAREPELALARGSSERKKALACG